MNQPLTSISSSGNPRNDNSCLEHIRRIRRNLPSQQVSRKISSDENLSAKGGADHYLSNLPSSNINRSKIENYKRIKMEEQYARQQLMEKPSPSQVQEPTSHRRFASNQQAPMPNKYMPSAGALASYSPLRNMAVPMASHDANIISSNELKGLREII